jgi:hypothetical protein
MTPRLQSHPTAARSAPHAPGRRAPDPASVPDSTPVRDTTDAAPPEDPDPLPGAYSHGGHRWPS